MKKLRPRHYLRIFLGICFMILIWTSFDVKIISFLNDIYTWITCLNKEEIIGFSIVYSLFAAFIQGSLIYDSKDEGWFYYFVCINIITIPLLIIYYGIKIPVLNYIKLEEYLDSKL